MGGVGGHRAYNSSQSDSISKANASLKWLQEFPCPSVGSNLDVQGMRTREEINAAKLDNWTFVTKQIAAIGSADTVRSRTLVKANQRGVSPSQDFQGDIEDLDHEIEAARAKSTTALTTWVVANWVEMSRIDPFYPPDSASLHPLSSYLSSYKDLQTITRQVSTNATVIPDRYLSCAVSMQNQMFEVNAAMVHKRADESSSPAEIRRLLEKYDAMRTTFVAPGIVPPATVQLIQKRAKDMENEAHRLAEQKRREEDEIRRKNAQAAYEIDLKHAKENLPIAEKFISALTNHNQSQMFELLHENVSLSTPKGSYSGKSAVAAKIGESASQKGGRIASPSIVGTDIVSVISHPKATLSLIIRIQDGLVNRLQLVK